MSTTSGFVRNSTLTSLMRSATAVVLDVQSVRRSATPAPGGAPPRGAVRGLDGRSDAHPRHPTSSRSRVRVPARSPGRCPAKGRGDRSGRHPVERASSPAGAPWLHDPARLSGRCVDSTRVAGHHPDERAATAICGPSPANLPAGREYVRPARWAGIRPACELARWTGVRACPLGGNTRLPAGKGPNAGGEARLPPLAGATRKPRP